MSEYETDESSSYEDNVSICHLLGGAYYETGNITDAENIYNKGLTVLFNRPEDVIGLPVLRTILCDLGLVYSTLRSNDKAEEYLAYAKYLYEQNLDMDIKFFLSCNNCKCAKDCLYKVTICGIAIKFYQSILMYLRY